MGNGLRHARQLPVRALRYRSARAPMTNRRFALLLAMQQLEPRERPHRRFWLGIANALWLSAMLWLLFWIVVRGLWRWL